MLTHCPRVFHRSFDCCCVRLDLLQPLLATGIKEATNINHIKTHYFTSHPRLVRRE